MNERGVFEKATEYSPCAYKYASVRLLDPPYHMDKIYDYRIPESCRHGIHKGSFVILPYGNGNRRIIGIVIGFADKASCEENRIKMLDGLASERLSLDEDTIALCDFMKKRYLCTFGDAVKLMISPGTLGKLRESYYATPEGMEADVKDCEVAHFEMLSFIRSHTSVTKDELSLAFPRQSKQSIEALIKKGFIVRSLDVGERKDSVEVLVSLDGDIDVDRAYAIVDGRDAEIKLRGDNQKAVLTYLAENGECEISYLCEQTGAARSTVKGLIDKNILSRRERVVRRDLLFLSAEAENAENGKDQAKSKKERVLSEIQKEAYDKLEGLYASHKPAVSLLFGVTGSGKTSVMLKMINRVLEDGKQVILLVPEISLTPQTFSIFYAEYGDKIAVVHSGLSQRERYDAYMRIKSGEASVIIGTRSAVFSPVKNLGMIIIDEEHEHTYKSDVSPRYHARDIAKFRCYTSNALLILASATPDVESYYNAMQGRYTLVRLDKRYGNAVLPDIETVNMRLEKSTSSINPLSNHLIKRMEEALGRKEQVIIFINRRGFNNYVVCGECGNVIKCPNCDVSLTYHVKRNDYSTGDLRCHMCGYTFSGDFKCPECGGTRAIKFGYGTQRVEKEISDIFPNASVIRMDQDTIENKGTYFELLNSFKRHEADILLGTSMITKGHDFPDVTLVGVLMADGSLMLDDYHAGERVYDMITQVIGRAGRGDKKGIAVIQAMNPENEMIRLACEQNYPAFYESEMKYRSAANFPPFCDIALIDLTSEKESILRDHSAKVRARIEELMKGRFSNIPLIVYGPCEAPVYKSEGKYRMRIIIKCKLNNDSRALFDILLCEHSMLTLPSKPTMTLNISPSQL